MAAIAINWTNIYKRYKGLWVALLDDEKTVVGSGKTAEQALGESQKKGHAEPILMRMPKSLTAYIG